MTDFLFSGLKADRVHRIDVNFNFPEKYLLYIFKLFINNLFLRNFDTIIGRTAHIKFLSSRFLLDMITASYPHFFE